ncbi:hypothetical protein BDV93DRAFT_609706 [Ceratobasidium sp. AG-I]|nr:hypothetical protein BDV93DRAFT_609706 [Ceratobasidium sp. AG-I]
MLDRRATQKSCAARDPPNNSCPRPAERSSKWCSTHEEIEGKQLKLYKRHTAALESDIALRKPEFLVRSVALKAGITDAMVTLEALREWYADARHQWVLATRTINARLRHHNTFYAGGDAGHLQYLDFLRSVIAQLESTMQKCDDLRYELLLQKESAKWVQHTPPPPVGSLNCGLETPNSSDNIVRHKRGETPPKEDGTVRPDLHVAPSSRSADHSLLTPPPSPTSLRTSLRGRKAKKTIATEIYESDVAGCQSASCPDEIICRDIQKRQVIVQRLCMFLQSEGGLATRAEVFATFFRRAIARSPSLFVRARTWEAERAIPVSLHSNDSLDNSNINSAKTNQPCFHASAGPVADFVRSDALTLPELERLSKKLPFVRGESVSAQLIRGAVADVFRPVRTNVDGTASGNCIPLLGGWVYERPWADAMPLPAWDVMHEMIACGGCALGTSRTFAEALSVRRHAFVGGHREDAQRLGTPIPACLPANAIPRFPRWKDDCSSPEIAMRILNVWLAADNHKTKRSELKKFTPKVRGMKPTYSEHEERHWMYLKMSQSEARLVSFVALLHASDKFTVLSQRGTKPNPKHMHAPANESEAWVTRVRSGATPVARRSARWTTSTVFRMEVFEHFHQRSPEFKAGLAYLDQDDVLEVVVMDNISGEWLPFLQSVCDVLVSACGYSSLHTMLSGELGVVEDR